MVVSEVFINIVLVREHAIWAIDGKSTWKGMGLVH